MVKRVVSGMSVGLMVFIAGCGANIAGTWKSACQSNGIGGSQRTLLQFDGVRKATSTEATYSDTKCSANEKKGDEKPAEYSINGNTLNLTYKGETTSFEYSLENDILKLDNITFSR